MRPTRTTTVDGHELVVHEWLTAREAREIRGVTFRHLKIGMEQGEGPGGAITNSPSLKDYDAGAVERETDELTIKSAVVSFDGATENILDRLLDGPDHIYQAVLEEARKALEDPNVAK